MPERKVILITGASSDIGLATALRLLADGHVVYGGARRTAAMAPIVEAGGHALALDVTDDASMTAAVDAVLASEGHIDVLVNNAGYGSYGAVEDVPLAEARNQVEVNVFGLARMTQLVLPSMRERRSGTIINISSIGGTIHTPLGAWYHATKHAVEAFTDCLRMEIGQFGLNAVIVAPGLIDTGFNATLQEHVMATSGKGPYAAMAQAIAAAAYKGRGSHPRVVANAIAKAVAARRPRTRYRAGQMSHLLIWVNRLLPDRLYDRLMITFAG